jgi:hypothetical protein
MARLQEQQKQRVAQEKAAAKAAEEQAKAQQAEQEAAAKAAQRELNNSREEQYRRQKRPMYTDADGVIQSQVSDDEWTAQQQQSAKNDTLRTQYFKQQRPWVQDSKGNIVPRHSDEEWQALNAEKAAKLEAAKVDAANKSLREKRKTELTAQGRIYDSNTDSIDLHTQELELEHRNAAAQAKKRADFIKQTQDQIENDPDLTAERQARMEQAIQQAQRELEEWQPKADALDAQVREQQAAQLAFRKAQKPLEEDLQEQEDALPTLTAPTGGASMGIKTPPQPGGAPAPRADATALPGVRQGVLSSQQAAVAADPTLSPEQRKTALEDIAARRDPVAYTALKRKRLAEADMPTLKTALEAELPALEQRAQQHAQRLSALEAAAAPSQQALQSLMERNRARLQQEHRGTDLVTVDGPDGQPMSLFADLADDYQDTLSD